MTLHKLNSRLLLRGEHCYLNSADECYFTDVYKCRQRKGISPLILSLKRNHKSAIVYQAQQLASTLPGEWASNTFVPMPTSSGANGAVRSIVNQLPLRDVRDLLVQNCDTPPAHDGWRLSPAQREELLVVNELAVNPDPNAVVVVDDVLTTGSHFRAAKMVLRHRWPGMRVIGLFLARVCSRRRECSTLCEHLGAPQVVATLSRQ